MTSLHRVIREILARVLVAVREAVGRSVDIILEELQAEAVRFGAE
jgi:hypothetical protein